MSATARSATSRRRRRSRTWIGNGLWRPRYRRQSPLSRSGCLLAADRCAGPGDAHRESVRKRWADRGRKTAIRSSGAMIAATSAWVPIQLAVEDGSGLPKRERQAVAVADSGFHWAMVPSQDGIVEVATNVLDRKPTGQTST